MMKTLRTILFVLMLAIPAQAQRTAKFVDSVQAMKNLNTSDINIATNGVVHVLGYYTAGDGGGGVFYWSSSDSTATNLGTVFKGKTTGSELATGRWMRVYKQNAPVSAKGYGAKGDGSTDDSAALINAISLHGDVMIPSGTFIIGANTTVAQTNRLILMEGAILKPSTNVAITIRGDFNAPMAKCIDTTHWVEGMGVQFAALGAGAPISRVPAIWLDWWGPSPNNSSGADTKAIKAWMYSTASGLAIPRKMQQGIYTLDNSLFMSNKWTLEASGNAQINFVPTNSNVGAIEVKGGNDIAIRGLILSSGRTSATNTFTNLFGIKVSPDTDRISITGCQMSRFNGGGIYLDGGVFAEGILYGEIRDNVIFSIDNSAANGGNGLTLASAVTVTNTLTTLKFIRNKINDCDRAYDINGGPGGTNIGFISFESETVETGGRNGVTATNFGYINARGTVKINNLYAEANQGDFGLWIENAGSAEVEGHVLASDYGGVNYMGTAVAFKNVAHGLVRNIRFNNTKTNFVAQLGTGQVVLDNCWFDLGFASFPNEATDTEITDRLIGNVLVLARAAPSIGDILTTDTTGKMEVWHAPLGANRHSAYAAGTAYSLTATPAALDFGTTDPSITISTAGTYMIIAHAGLKYNGATFAANQTATLKLRRTNNTAADLTSASRPVTLDIVTTFTGTAEIVQLPPVFYTATAGDVVTIFGSLSATPSVGSVDTDSAEIIAVRVQ